MDCQLALTARLRQDAHYGRLWTIVLCLIGGLNSAAYAQSSTVVEDLAADLIRMQQESDELKSSAPTASNDSFAPLASAPMICCEPAESKPKFPTVRVTGFFQADAVWFDQDEAKRNAIIDGNPIGDLQDGADFRRARLAATGNAWDNVTYMLEMDFAFPGRPSFMDVWLEINDVLGANSFRVGQFRQPFGMDGQTSVQELTFLERSLPFAFLPFRQIGAMLHGNRQDELATWALAGYRFPTDPYGGNVGDNGGFGLSSRLTGVLLGGGDGELLHVGGGYSFIDPANDMFQYRNQAEIFVSETGGGVPIGVPGSVPAFVDTGLIYADHANLFHVELAVALGSLHAQSEAFFASVNQANGPTVLLPGTSAQVGYFLTGEKRPYNGKNGVFSQAKSNSNFGKDGWVRWRLQLAGLT